LKDYTVGRVTKFQHLANTISGTGQSDLENTVGSLSKMNDSIRRSSGNTCKKYELELHKITAKQTRLD
jgi:hypothetical protein